MRPSLAWESVWSSLPSEPGVYWFLNDDDDVLYVGKAKDIRKRIAQYRRYDQLPPKSQQLVTTATELKHEVLKSELEALLVEAELIRTHQPPFNILLKDDKSPLYIHITAEQFPRVYTRRKRDIIKNDYSGTIIGPLPSARKVKEVLGIARKMFPWCNKRRSQLPPVGERDVSDACFYYHIDQCPGVCTGEIAEEEYADIIDDLKRFLRGKKRAVVNDLRRRMKQQAAVENFEAAAQLRDRVEAIVDVTQRYHRLKPQLTLPTLKLSEREEGIIQLQRILSTYTSLPKQYPLDRIEGYDVSNIMGKAAAVGMVVFEDGAPAKEQYRLFNIRSIDTPNDYHMLKEALQRRQNHAEWGEPNLLVIDGGKGQLRGAHYAWTWTTPIISIAKDPDRLIIPKFERNRTNDPEQLIPDGYHVLNLPKDHLALKLIQRIRDESHRYSKRQHKRLRQRQLFQ